MVAAYGAGMCTGNHYARVLDCLAAEGIHGIHPPRSKGPAPRRPAAELTANPSWSMPIRLAGEKASPRQVDLTLG